MKFLTKMPKIGIAKIKDFWETLILAGPLISPRIDDVISKHTKHGPFPAIIAGQSRAALIGFLFTAQGGSRNQKFTSLTMPARLFLF